MPQFYVYVYRDPSRKNEPIYVGKTPEARQKNSDAHKGKIQPKSICPHCGRLSGPSRYHFDKCKSRK